MDISPGSGKRNSFMMGEGEGEVPGITGGSGAGLKQNNPATSMTGISRFRSGTAITLPKSLTRVDLTFRGRSAEREESADCWREPMPAVRHITMQMARATLRP